MWDKVLEILGDNAREDDEEDDDDDRMNEGEVEASSIYLRF